MILTGNEISKMRSLGKITIIPFDPCQVNPNSYNYRLGPRLGVPKISKNGTINFEFINIPIGGYTLLPHIMYLGHTLEILGSDVFAMSLIGRSTLGRLGLFLQISANLGHTGSSHQWTLEIVVAKKTIIYKDMLIGQISFWTNSKQPNLYKKGYTRFNNPQISQLTMDKKEKE